MKIREMQVKVYDADDLRALKNMPWEDVIQGLEWYWAHLVPYNRICEQEIEDGREYSAERYEATKRSMALRKAIEAVHLLDMMRAGALVCNLKEEWEGTH